MNTEKAIPKLVVIGLLGAFFGQAAESWGMQSPLILVLSVVVGASCWFIIK